MIWARWEMFRPRFVWPSCLATVLLVAGCGEGSSPPHEPVSATTYGTSSTGMPTATRTMDFETCLATVRDMATDLGVAPINIVETSDVRVVRFNTSDGSVLITCSGPDQKMIAVQSPHQG